MSHLSLGIQSAKLQSEMIKTLIFKNTQNITLYVPYNCTVQKKPYRLKLNTTLQQCNKMAVKCFQIESVFSAFKDWLYSLPPKSLTFLKPLKKKHLYFQPQWLL